MFTQPTTVGMLLTLLLATATLSASELQLTATTAVRFATTAEGVQVLTTQDRFVNALSQFDRQSRLNAKENVSRAAYLDFIGRQVVDWDPAEKEKLGGLIESVRGRFAALSLSLPLPPEVLLIRTTGREEGQAAHCRGKAIVLPPPVLARPDERLERLLVHELFHILSSHQPELRARLYGVIGFQMCAPVELPLQLRERKITNPDGPLIDAYIDVEVDGVSRPSVPVLFASAEKFDPDRGRSFFEYLTFRLMLIQRNNETWTPVLEGGEPVMLEPANVASYHQQIGRNTKYILHPDEVLADNFVHLVFQTPDLPTPRVPSEMQRELGGT